MNGDYGRLATAILVGGLLLFLSIILLIVAYRLFNVIVILLFAVMLSQGIRPLVDRMEKRRIPRALGVLLIYLGLLLVVTLAGWLVVPPLVRDATRFVTTLPEQLDRMATSPGLFGDLLRQTNVPDNLTESLSDVVNTLANNLSSLISVPLAVFDVLSAILSVFVFALLFSVSGASTLAFILSFVHPSQRGVVKQVMNDMGTRLGAYLRSELLLMTAVGVLAYIGLLIIGVPFPHVLAVVAFFTEAIPMVGPVLGAVPGVLLALFISPVTALWAVLLYVVIQLVENYLLVPIIHSAQMKINAVVVLLAILIGGNLFGLLGALIAVPVAATLQLFVEEVVIPWRQRQFTSR